MQRSILILISVVLFIAFAGQAATSGALPQDRLVVRPRRIVLVRSAKLGKQFPHRKTARVTYPVISGLSDRAVLRRIRSLLDFKNIFDYSLQEYRQDSWLSEFDYTINYNRSFLFDITFRQSGAAAYPAEHTKHFLINLKDGRTIKASDVFHTDQFQTLAALVDRKLQAELSEMTTQVRKSSDFDQAESQSIVDALADMKFGPENLDDFSVSAKGIIFLYDAGLPHAIRTFEPQGRYFFSYSELTPYLNRNGPLGQFIR
jgi:hypothetical protein